MLPLCFFHVSAKIWLQNINIGILSIVIYYKGVLACVLCFFIVIVYYIIDILANRPDKKKSLLLTKLSVGQLFCMSHNMAISYTNTFTLYHKYPISYNLQYIGHIFSKPSRLKND